MDATKTSMPGTGWNRLEPHTEEQRAFLRERVIFFYRVLFWGFAASFFFSILLHATYSWLRPELWGTAVVIAVAALVLVFAVGLGARMAQPSVALLHAIDATIVIVVATAFAIEAYIAVERPPNAWAFFIWTIFIVFGRALIVPSSATRTAWLSAAIMLPFVCTAVAMSFAVRNPLGLPPAALVAGCSMMAGVTVATGAIGSRVIYGLRQKVREAQQLGQYTLEEEIGRGGMGVVYRARHAMLRRPTALKLLRAQDSSRINLRRFEREVQLTSELTHPNTVQIYDYGRSLDGTFYYAMEFLDGIDLGTLVETEGPLAPARTIHILVQVAGALDEAHQRGLIHRDIKPANIILVSRGSVPDIAKVVDFGLVTEVVSGSTELSQTNMIAGTPAYLAPEVISDPAAITLSVDIYSLGCVAYFLLTGHIVFNGTSVVEVCSDHLHTTPVRPSLRLGRELPKDLEELVLRCLAKAPRDRPASAMELATELSRLQDANAWSTQEAREWWEQWRARRGDRDRTTEEATLGLTVDLHDRGRFFDEEYDS